MTCKNCGGELFFQNGVAICPSCNSNYKVDHLFENIDVAICYIEYDSSGRRTKDSILAQDIYQKLEAKKVQTFYERVSVSTVAADDLEQIRYSAIHSAKVVLVVGTSIESFSDILEKYGTYFSQKTVIPVYTDVNPSYIPKELSKIQALNCAAIGWEKDLESGLLRLLGREKEIDLEENYKKAKKFRILLISALTIGVIIVVATLVFFNFWGHPETPPSTPSESSSTNTDQQPKLKTNQELYEEAQSLLNEGNYHNALSIYSEIQNYKDSKKQTKNILDRYDGYYQTQDKSFSIYLNIENADALSLEMTTVSQNGTAKVTINGVWAGTEQSYSFADNFSNQGNVFISLKNDEFSIVVQMESSGDFASIGNQTITFKLADKTDRPEVLQVTNEILLSWLQAPTTTDDIEALGFKITKDGSGKIMAGGAPLDGVDLCQVEGSDITLLFCVKDPAEQKVLYNYGKGSNKQIVCAAFAPAEYLIPDEIGTENRSFVKKDTLFVSGGSSMQIDWGGCDIFIMFTTPTSNYYDYSPSGTIKADTMVGAICKKIAGNGFFVRSVLKHKHKYSFGDVLSGDYVAETSDCYVIAAGFPEKGYQAYRIDKKTFDIIETFDVHRTFHKIEGEFIHTNPSYESSKVREIPQNTIIYYTEQKVSEDYSVWGKLLDGSGWFCIYD